MSSNSIGAPLNTGKITDFVAWTDSISAGATLTKTISVGTRYRRGDWLCIAADAGGSSSGPDGSTRAAYNGNIISSASASEGRYGLALSGVYSSGWSSTINSNVSGSRWTGSANNIRLSKVYFDGAGNVAFDFINSAGTSQSLNVRAMVAVW